MSQSKYKYYKPLEKSQPPSHTLKVGIFVYLLNGSYSSLTLSQREVRKRQRQTQTKIDHKITVKNFTDIFLIGSLFCLNLLPNTMHACVS